MPVRIRIEEYPAVGECLESCIKDKEVAIEAKAKKPVNPKRVMNILNTLSAEGFISREVASIGNSPILIWKI